MPVLLGIDTGGTNTDAVLLDDEKGVISAAKALTTKHDLSAGIQNAVEAVLPNPPPDIRLVSLSSTLATNAIVEGKGSPICLLLIGYDSNMVAMAGLERVVAKNAVVFIQGGHTVTGEEQAPLDIDAARQSILIHAPRVAAFAISGFFGVLNPTHELEVKRLVHRLTGLPVTCGHELTTHLHAPRRALTVALNARLIPLLLQLILGVRKMLARRSIHAPLMVVRGDGSLINAKMALEQPIETILSGPAASVVGAHYLSNMRDAIVIDMGGTTTDIVVLHDGHPTLNPKGAWIGDWQTMVQAVDVHTTGLGGDSEIRLENACNLSIGPCRVIPLSILAEQYPSVLGVLRGQFERCTDSVGWDDVGRFILCQQLPGAKQSSTSSTYQEILRALNDNDGLVPLSELLDGVKYPSLYRRCLDELMEHDIVIEGAFTPTDALHVLGRYRHGSVEAAELGAALWARRLGTSEREFCERVIRQVTVQAERAVITSALAEEGLVPGNEDSVGRLFIDRALGIGNEGIFSVVFSLGHPLVGIGAPAGAYLPSVAAQLHTPLYVPEHAEVANAIGAVASGIVQTIRILIQPLDGGNTYRVYLPFGVRNFEQVADAVAYAKNTARRLACERAQRAGASTVQVCTEQHDRTAQIGGERVYIQIEILATAVGRPKLK